MQHIIIWYTDSLQSIYILKGTDIQLIEFEAACIAKGYTTPFYEGKLFFHVDRYKMISLLHE